MRIPARGLNAVITLSSSSAYTCRSSFHTFVLFSFARHQTMTSAHYGRYSDAYCSLITISMISSNSLCRLSPEVLKAKSIPASPAPTINTPSPYVPSPHSPAAAAASFHSSSTSTTGHGISSEAHIFMSFRIQSVSETQQVRHCAAYLCIDTPSLMSS